MHILLLDLGREMRGGQWQVYYLARALGAAEGFEPIIAAPAQAPLLKHAAELEGVRVLPLPGGREWDPRNLHAIRKLVHREGVRILHSHCAKSAALAAMCKKLWGDKVVVVHSRRVSYPLKTGWRGSKYLRAEAVVGVSQEISNVLVASGMPAVKVHTIHSGIDCARYTRKRNRGDGRMVIGMVGAFTAQKGHEVLIRAMAELQSMDGLPPWEVRLIGAGELFNTVAALAGQLGVDSRLAMLGWQDSREFLPDFDILAVPSVDGEGSSGTIKEGWCTGLPVITSDLPSNLELVQDGVNGLVFPNRDHEALARCLHRVMTDRALAQTLVDAGHGSATEFSDTRMAQAYMALYGTL